MQEQRKADVEEDKKGPQRNFSFFFDLDLQSALMDPATDHPPEKSPLRQVKTCNETYIFYFRVDLKRK